VTIGTSDFGSDADADIRWCKTTRTSHSYIYEKMKSKLNSGIACYHFDQHFVFLSPI